MLRSLRLRLLVAGALTIVLALGAAGFGLLVLFERHVERRVVRELRDDIRQLLAGLQVADNGLLSLSREPDDQRYDQPLSGLYWQVEKDEKIVFKSRSLWDNSLALPASQFRRSEAGQHQHRITGPRGEDLLVAERLVRVKRGGKAYEIELITAIDRAEIATAVRAFRRDLVVGLTLLGFALMAAFGLAISVGLGPLGVLRERLNRMRAGKARRLSGPFPSEVQPLVRDLNSLLDYQERTIADAERRAGDLAHGLKTPLTAMATIADELREKGDAASAAELEALTETMRRHVERELVVAQVRTRAGAQGVSDLGSVARSLLRTMMKLPRGDTIDWQCRIPPGLRVPVDELLLTELLGNIFDNARKWAKSKVLIEAEERPGGGRPGGGTLVRIADDGPGVDEAEIALILERGGRLDRQVDGSGLGLAIVRDIVDALGGVLALGRSELGGLAVEITFAETPARHGSAGLVAAHEQPAN